MAQIILKRSGMSELFQTKKIYSSMRNADVSRYTASWVARGIHYFDGITTTQVRNQVIDGIREREPQAAQTFNRYVGEKA
jgi:hypothetical protein